MSKWPTHTLAEVAESTVDGPFGSALKGDHYVEDHGVRVVRLANLGDGRYVDSDEAFVSAEYADVLARHSVAPGDVLVASLGDDNHRPGRACLYPPEFTPGIVKADCFRVRPGELIDGRFLMETLNSERVIDQTRRLAQGVTRDRINLGQLRKVRVPVPPLEEQRRMAEILDTIDETIQATERVIAKLKQMHDGLRRSRFAELLKSGDHRQVGACFDMNLGKMLSPAAKTGTRPAPYLANRNVQWGRCRIDDLDEMDFSESERRKFALTSGDVLVCEGGEVGRTAIWRGEVAECYFQKAIHRLRTRGDVVPEFMLHFMRHAAEVDLFRSHTSQTSIAHLTGEQLARVSIPVPPMEVQNELIGALASVADRADVESSELAKLRAVRVGLAADLLSGRVRTVAA